MMFHRRKLSSQGAGFTLIEILLVIAIFSILAAVAGTATVSLYKGYIAYSERVTVAAILVKARSQAMANVGQTSHGVYLGGADYVIFEGSSYAARNADYDEIIPKSAGIAASGLSEVVFTPLDGESSTVGAISLSTGVNPLMISINSEGQISY